ncbi:MAG: hypothetical protein AAF627_02055 [Myxococcota bacterium]
MRRPRQLTPGAWWSVVVRCARSEFRLRPDSERTQAVGFFLAKALKACPGIKLAAVSQMSNHMHLVLRDDESQLSNFMCRFEGPLAKMLNVLDDTRGQVFEKRFTSIQAIDPDAVLECIVYSVMNPVSAHLVARIEDWPGLLVWPGKESALRFSRNRPLMRSPSTEESYVLSIPQELLCEKAKSWLRQAVVARTNQLASKRRGRRVLGCARVLAQRVFDVPKRTKRSPLPICHASCLERWWNFLRQLRDFISSYRMASLAFRAGDRNVHFPDFSFRPWTATFT